MRFLIKRIIMASIQILNRTTISDKKYRLENILFEKPNLQGEMHHQENEVYFRPDAVAVLLVDEKKEMFLLARQFRLPTFLNGNDNGYLIETCAGLIDDGESPEQAAHREGKEETGYDIANLTKYGAVYSSAGGITEYVHLFSANYDSKGEHEEGGGAEGEGEDIELLEWTFDEAREKVMSGAIRDAKTVMLLQYYFMTAAQPK